MLRSNTASPMTEDDEPESRSPQSSTVASEVSSKKITKIASMRRWILQRFGLHSSPEETVDEFIEEHGASKGKPLSSEERTLLRNILSFGELKISDVMTPQSDIVAVADTISLNDLKHVVIDKEHTRMPVYHGTLDDVMGFIHIKDLMPYLGTDKTFKLKNILRNVLFIPPSMKVIDLLVKMRSSAIHLAIVLDEYGGTHGLVTMEDLMEEIVGEIQDEHDDIIPQDIVQISENHWESKARIDIEKLEETLATAIASDKEREDIDTLGGLLFINFGYVPTVGESITHDSGFVFEILEVEPQRIKRVKITRSITAPEAEEV